MDKDQDKERDENMEEDENVEGDENMGGDEGAREGQNREGDQSWEEYQEMEEDDNRVKVTPRKLAPLPEMRFSPRTPMLSSVLKAQRTPKPHHR